MKYEDISKKSHNNLNKWIENRNQILHFNKDISNRNAKKYASEILEFLKTLNIEK